MSNRLDNWFRPFEGTRSPYPIAVFRIAFFLGVAVHFVPSLIWLDDGYARGAIRTDEWSHWLYVNYWRIPHGVLRAGSVLTIIACAMGLVGFRPRLAALVTGLGCYAFASFNSLHLQTLALVGVWAVLPLFVICGGSSNALSVDAWLRRGTPPAREPSLLGSLILFQILLAVLFSGIEKLLAGWPWTNEMRIVLSYPEGFIVRDWVAAVPWLHGAAVSTALTWLTLLVELGTPILLLVRRTRMVALAAYEAFFLGIIAMLEVPPLFYFMFAAAPLLALDDAQLERILAGLRRITSRRRAGRSPSA